MNVNEIRVGTDPVAEALRTYAQNILVVVFGLLPIFFIPSQLAPFEYTKIFFVLIGVVAALILFSLSALRSGSLNIGVSFTLISLWLVALVAFLSSLLSGDFSDSIMGDVLSVHATVFVGVLALIATVWMLLDVKKGAVMRLYMLLALSTLVLVAYHVIRLIFGPEILSFGIFMNSVATPVGGWNDLALFLGLSVILSLVALEQLPLTKSGRILFGIVAFFALVMLGVINFFTVWLVLGLTSLAVIVYSLGKDRFTGGQPTLVSTKSVNMTSLVVSLLVFVVSVLFIIGGSALGGYISQHTGVSYIEVRPSLEATANIAKNVYQENAFLGIGTNRFSDAWRLYKDESINSTIFWNTDFNAGNGYLTTFFITTGVLGGVAWLLFLVLFVGAGIRMLFVASDADRMWYFIGVSSFVSAVYIWGMSLIYVPGAVMLMLGALCTGITLSAHTALKAASPRVLFLTTNRRTGFVFTLVVIAVIIGSVSSLYSMGRHYAAAYTFNQGILSFQQSGSVDEAEKYAMSAYGLSMSDVYARRVGEYEFARMNSLLKLTAPTAEEQKQFESAVVSGVNAADQAKTADPTEPSNYSLLGGIYSLLISVNIEGVYDRAVEALTKAKDLNPKNPLMYLELAILDGRVGKYDTARTYAEKAIALKPNFTDAFFYLSQIDIVTGNVEGAVKSTQSIIALEPQNPARYYQLGILYASQNNVDGAIAAFEKAVSLDQNYANARYFLALAYDAKGRGNDAKTQLEKVLELNPGNGEVTALIQMVSEGKRITGGNASSTEQSRIVGETSDVQDENGTISTSKAPDSPLVTPVNTAPEAPAVKETPAAPQTTE